MKCRVATCITLAFACLIVLACSSDSVLTLPEDSSEGFPEDDPLSISGNLIISNNGNRPSDMEALRNTGVAFTAEYPDVLISYIDNSTDDLRESIAQTLETNAPDVIAWYTGNAMAPLVDANLLDDVSDIWASKQLVNSMPAFNASLSKNGKQWGIPISTYGWGIYYRKDIFESLSISEPRTWAEFLNAAETLKTNNVTPLTIGTKFLWPSAGVFDYLNLRINGHEVHNDLTAGKIKYTDERIRSVFTTWKELVDKDYFINNHQNLSWLDAITPMVNGEAAMYLMGNFIVNQYTDLAGSSDNLGFFAFPEIRTNIAVAEEAPTDAFFLPKNATNKPAARAFLSFISRPEVQSEWNKTLGQIPAHNGAELIDNFFITNTAATVRTANALSQFFDRDAPATMAQPAFAAFQEFMLDTTKLESILFRLDGVQATAY